MLRVAWNDRKYLKIAGIGDANDYDYDNCDDDDDDHENQIGRPYDHFDCPLF